MISVDSTTSQPHSTDADKPIKSTCVGCWRSNQSRTHGNTSCQKEARGRFQVLVSFWEVFVACGRRSSWTNSTNVPDKKLHGEYSIIEQVSLSRSCLLHAESASLRDRERTLFGKLLQGERIQFISHHKTTKEKEEKIASFLFPANYCYIKPAFT